LKYLKKVLKIIKNIAKEADAKGCIFKKLKEKFKSIDRVDTETWPLTSSIN
jgi:hypothetical protein